MQPIIWIIACFAVATLVVGVARAVRRDRRTYVPSTPVTISVTEPVEDVLESPRHAAEARAAAEAIGAADGGRFRGLRRREV